MLDITGADRNLQCDRTGSCARPAVTQEQPAAMQARQGNTATANSKARVTGQAAQQLQPAPLSHLLGAWPWDLSTNKADHRINVHILINAQNAVIATRMPVGAVEDGRLPRGRRACGVCVIEPRHHRR